MITAPTYWPGEFAPVNDAYAAVDLSGEILEVAVMCEAGDELPELAISGHSPVGFVRLGEATSA